MFDSGFAQSPDDVKKQIPTGKAGLENTVETAKKAAKPLATDPARTEKLKEMHQRALLVMKRSADFQKSMLEGKVHPWGEFAEQYPAMQRSVTKITADYQALLNEENLIKRSKLESAITTAIQPIGYFLLAANPSPVDLSLTNDQTAELKALANTTAEAEPDPKSTETMKHLTSSSLYTLLHIPVPIKISAPPNTEIYLKSGGGGMFPNGLTMQKITTSPLGIAETSWVSKGDSIGLTVITATSPKLNNPLSYEIEVVQLQLRKLPQLPDVAKRLKALKEKSLQQLKNSNEKLTNPAEPQEPTDIPEAPKTP